MLLVGLAIFKYWTASRDTLYIGISKFMLTGPISFLLSCAVASRKVILATSACSCPP